MPDLERELKLTPRNPTLLDQIARIERLGPLRVVARRTEVQENAFFDSADSALRDARLALRRRLVAGEEDVQWPIKGPGRTVEGITARPEVEARLETQSSPQDAVHALARTARVQGHAELAEQVASVLARTRLSTHPYLETRMHRRILDLESDDHAWAAELALDDVTVVGHPEYRQVEIEVELRRGPEEVLARARAAIEALGEVQPSVGSKLSRALAYLQLQR